MSEYRVRRGFRLSESEAVALQKELNRIEKRLRRPWTVQDVYRAAQDPKSAFHAFLDWNDASAAVEYRLQQVRYIIRAISVVLPEYDTEVRANISVSLRGEDDEDPETGYMTTERAIKERPDVVAMYENRLRHDAKRIADEARAWKAMFSSEPVREFVAAAERLAVA